MRVRWYAVWRRLGRQLSSSLVDAICPPHCPACGLPGSGLCVACSLRLEARRWPWCPRCGEPVVAEGARCTWDHARVRGLALARAPFRYRGAAGDMVRRLKFEHDPAAGLFLQRAMAQALAGWAVGAGRRVVVVSVPLHRRRLRERGLDQAAFLAQGVAQRLGLAYVPRAMARDRDTLPQGDPRVTSRVANVVGAFSVRLPRRVAGVRVVLVDDVLTSGTTAGECARQLRAAGAREVVLLSAARA